MGNLALLEDIFRVEHLRPEDLAPHVLSFLDVCTTSYGRSTHYNTREQQASAEIHAHAELFRRCRDLYETLLLLPGTTDHSRQLGISTLLANPRGADVFLDPKIERRILELFVQEMPPQRLLKMFDALRGRGGHFGIKRSNNARTRKLILKTILNSPRLELWVVKYREKVKGALVHAWGQKLASFIGEAVKQYPKLSKMSKIESGALRDHVFRYVTGDTEGRKFRVLDKRSRVCQCLAFLFGKRVFYKEMRMLNAFVDARKDLQAGSILPTAVLEGIRSIYHKSTKPGDIIGIKAKSKTMTTHEKRVVQKRAAAAGVDVEMRVDDYSSVELYIHAFENGMDGIIQEALTRKAKITASTLPFSYKRIGILLDASKSMEGSREQPLRPMAVALSLRDALVASANYALVSVCGGTKCEEDKATLTRPKGSTGLAERLLFLMMDEPEAIFIISDGYENAPAGRTGDVLRLAREYGNDTPIIHFNPVFAAETGAVRSLCDGVDKVVTMPVKSPELIGTTVVRGLIESDPRQGIENLIRIALAAGGEGFSGLLGGES
jgi:hypothetical protein